jgi:hypothetical protein
MKDSVFEGALLELPTTATNIEVSVLVSYETDKGNHRERTTRRFPSKAEATFRRETAKNEEAIKKVSKDTADAVALIRGLEDRLHKRLNKLERKNDPDTT